GSEQYPQPARTVMMQTTTDKSGNEQEEAKLQIASKQIVHTVIQQAVQQLSQESQRKKGTSSSMSLQLERGQLTKKHEKK
uniref:A-kinase anchor inhibitor 1 n=1 Tax=Salvator merianae TaxID=96440 RepID=A0A8D0DT30_SALMN